MVKSLKSRFVNIAKNAGVLFFSVALIPVATGAEPFLDEDGYFWSETKSDAERPVIWDRADLILYTDGIWRWTLAVDGQTLMKVPTNSFYNPEENPRIAELADVLHKARIETDLVETKLSERILAQVTPKTQEEADRLNQLLSRLRRGEKGDAITKALDEWIKPEEARQLITERNQKRQAIFDRIEQSNQRMRLDLALGSSPSVPTMVVSERALFVPASKSAHPLETDDSAEGFSESIGIAFALVPVGEGQFYAVLTNKPQPGSLGEKLDLIQGDAVTAFNDVPITSADDLNKARQFRTVITIIKQVDGKARRALVQ